MRTPPRVQAKLVVNQPGDAFEREADRVADLSRSGATSGPAPVGTAGGSPPGIQRKCAACEAGGTRCPRCEDEDRVVQRKAAGGGGDHGPVNLNPPDAGHPLHDSVRSRVEPLLGADLSQVRVHSSPAANATAAQLDAKAFTHGNHIWLGANQSSSDVALMSHEATHVVQQSAAPSVAPAIQRAPADYQHPEDGGNVLARMQSRIAEASDSDAPDMASYSRPNRPASGAAAPVGNGRVAPVGGGAAAPTGAGAPRGTEPSVRRAATRVDRAELAAKKGELAPAARPDVNRPANERPRVVRAAQATHEQVEAPTQPVGTPRGAGAGRRGHGDPGARGAAQKAASLSDRAFAQAETISMPAQPTPVMTPNAIVPLDASGQGLPADPEADQALAGLAQQVQRLRIEGNLVRARAAEARRNAALLEGNIAMARDGIAQSEGAVATSQGHLAVRRQVVGQARQALVVSEQKAETVAQGAPGFRSRADEGKAESGPMAGEASGMAAENAANTPEDEEAAEDAREQGSQMNQASSDIGTTDDAITQTQNRATSLSEEAAQAKAMNEQSATRLATTEQTLETTGGRLGQMTQQNGAARGGIAAVASGPARIRAQAAALDQQGVALLQASHDLEARIHATQQRYADGMRAVPQKAEVRDTAGGDAVVQRAGYEGRSSVDLVGGMPSWLSGVDPVSDEQRAVAAAEAEARRRQEINEITNGGQRSFESLDAADKMGIALRLTGRHLFGGLGRISWPGWGGLARGAGHLALGLIDPRSSLTGVMSGLGMVLSGGANLFSAEQWRRDPLGNFLKSAADIATGLTIILGSITALAGVIIAIMTAITILSFGTAAPVTGPVIAFCSTVLTTVGGWTIAVGKVALVLQALVFIKNLIDAATAQTAAQLQQSADRMTEDASNAGNVVMQIGMAKLSQIGGRQMQSAIRDAGGGVRFAARLGAQGPVGSTVAGIRSQGFRAYGRQALGGARTSLRNAGSYLRNTSVTQGAKDFAGAARRAWRDLTQVEGAPVSGREGVSRDFLVGGEVPRGTYGSGARGIVRDELEMAGISGAPSPRPVGGGTVADGPAPAGAGGEARPGTSEPVAPSPVRNESVPREAGISPDEASALNHTRAKSGAELTPDEALAERDIARRMSGSPDEPVELPNRHKIEPGEAGGFCRRSVRICFDAQGNVVRPRETLRDILAERGGIANLDEAVEALVAQHGGDVTAALRTVTRQIEAGAEVAAHSVAPPPPAPAASKPGERVAPSPEPLPATGARVDQIDFLILLRRRRAALRPTADVVHDPVRSARWNDYVTYYDGHIAEVQAAINARKPLPEAPLRWREWENFRIMREATEFQNAAAAELTRQNYEVVGETWITNPSNRNPRAQQVGENRPDWRPDQLAVRDGRVTAVSNKQRNFDGTASPAVVMDTVRDDVRDAIQKYTGTLRIHRPASELPASLNALAPNGNITVNHVILIYDGRTVAASLRPQIVQRATTAAQAINPSISIEVIFTGP